MDEVEAFQNPWEFEHLRTLVAGLEPEAILEVGAMYGGTLWHWMYLANRVVVVDDQMREAERWREWADDLSCDLVLLQGDSRDRELIHEAQRLGMYDFAFIDGDHTYDVVCSDWEAYAPVSKVVALHDILPRPAYGVSRLWNEVKLPGKQWVEICQYVTLEGNEGPCGIGVIWV